MDRSTLIRFDDTSTDAASRVDFYGPIHKALRSFMADTLVRVGRCDPADAYDLGDALGALRALLATMRGHLEHENTFVHPAIEARRPGASRLAADDHDEHVGAIAALSDAADALEAAPAAERAPLRRRLYLGLSRFVAENLEHMVVEETGLTAVLREAYDDAELGAIHDRLVASIPPAEHAATMRWMMAAIGHDERLGMLLAMRAHAPAPVFDGTVSICRDVLAPRDWAKLAKALELPAVAGLVEIW